MSELLSPEQAECLKDNAIPELPIIILYHWAYLCNVLMAKRVENHPRLGSFTCADGDMITTSRVLWINREVGLAQTRNTLYVLRNFGMK